MGARPRSLQSDRISADTILPRLLPGAARVSELVPTAAAALQGAVGRCPPPPIFARANNDRMPSKASTMEHPRRASAHAAMPVCTMAVAAITAGVEAITAGDMRLSLHFGRFPFAFLTALLLAVPAAASGEALAP